MDNAYLIHGDRVLVLDLGPAEYPFVLQLGDCMNAV
jgi:hypothetical protein